MADTYQSKSQWLRERLLEFDSSAKSRVVQTHRSYNNLIRNHIRTETALRFNSALEEGNYGITVQIVDDFPPAFRPIIEDYEQDFWELFLKASILKNTAHGLGFIEGKYSQLSSLIAKKNDNQMGFMLADISGIRSFVDELLAFINHYGILSRLNELDQSATLEAEVLGAYFFRDSRIHLFWPVIAIIALELGVSVESLTIVTLIHELAHAYTHLGQDTDNDRWDTEAFANTDLLIVEGLAQFYTELVCQRLKARQPDILKTFTDLRENQGEVYNSYRYWLERSDRKTEVIRLAMINCRKNCITKVDRFIDSVKEAEYMIGR
jgi:hypothetical protein